MRKFRHFSAVLSLFLLVPASIIWAQTITQQKGLTTLVFPTQHGTVKIYLPDDIRAGDIISGTVVADPSGNNERQRERNLVELGKYSLQIDGNKYTIPVKKEPFKWIIPKDRQLSASVELLQVNGSKAGQFSLPFNINPAAEPRQEGCVIPSHALTAAPVQIKGSFDGDLANTQCRLGGQSMEVIAESPRQCQAYYPESAQGSRMIQVSEKGRENCSRQVSGVELQVSSGRLNLRKGEQTFLTVKITGLQDLPATAVLTVTNNSTNVVSMYPSNDVVIPLLPEKVAGGSFEQQFEINSIMTGNYSVNVDLQLPEGPVRFYDVPETNENAKNDTVPCPENTLATKQAELESLRSELAGIDAAIAKAKADTAACGREKRKKSAAASAANEEFKRKEQRKKNWDKSGVETPQNVKDDYNNAKTEKDKAEQEADEQAKKCDELALKLKELENRKLALPGEIKKQEEQVDVLKTEAEKCKLEAEAKKKKAEDDKRKAEEAAAAATAAEAAAKETRRESVAHQRYLLQNIYSLGLISSREFWEAKGLWDWLPETLSKPVGDFFEDKGNPSPIPIDIIPALAGIYQVFGKMLDPCSPDGGRKTIERLGRMINTKTNLKYTDEEALRKTEQMCELLQKLKALSNAAGGK